MKKIIAISAIALLAGAFAYSGASQRVAGHGNSGGPAIDVMVAGGSGEISKPHN